MHNFDVTESGLGALHDSSKRDIANRIVKSRLKVLD